MSGAQEAAARVAFDAQAGRFKPRVDADDYRLRAVVRALAPVPGRRILDLGCGKGRFAAQLADLGARVVGLDLSRAMLAQAQGIPRLRGSARRLPFAAGQFDRVMAIEAFEHFEPGSLDEVLAEMARVLCSGGRVAIVDKSAAALDGERPWLPKLAVTGIDERRGRGMYPRGGRGKEHWFWPGLFRARLERHFEGVRVAHLLSPQEARAAVFRRVPAARLMTLWTGWARGERDV